MILGNPNNDNNNEAITNSTDSNINSKMKANGNITSSLSSSSSSSSSSQQVVIEDEDKIVIADESNMSSKATLIVVPTSLQGQWWRELQSRISPTQQLSMINVSDMKPEFSLSVPKKDIRILGETPSSYLSVYEDDHCAHDVVNTLSAADKNKFCELINQAILTEFQLNYSYIMTYDAYIKKAVEKTCFLNVLLSNNASKLYRLQ